MNLTISDKGQAWFKSELNLKDGDGIRFFGKYGGSTNVHVGFTTGMTIAEPSTNTLAKIEVNGITYFTEESDEWFFHGFDLAVDYDEKLDEPTYTYTAK
ncbi:hypothetical protein G7081_04255 [Vagococcus coleopterorum]|uniref:Iron-sulfur cluster biosynthesis protein n=1 Tax=Vagococcus coleopterorum TaxID=2714946 RepID=A0A6G8AN12_9ENTE|nr:hypothetical protein [Vagococcus coleopterorum]QIL46332.1 hypothetical protein G7081_04255 [Vagococcus coleopterorum]